MRAGCVGSNATLGSEGEGIIGKKWKGDVCIIVHPRETRLDPFYFNTDETVKNVFDGIRERGLPEKCVDAFVHLIDKHGQCVVNSVSAVLDPAEHLIVEIGIGAIDRSIRLDCPRYGSGGELLDDDIRKLADLGGELGGGFLDLLEENILRHGAYQSSYTKRENE